MSNPVFLGQAGATGGVSTINITSAASTAVSTPVFVVIKTTTSGASGAVTDSKSNTYTQIGNVDLLGSFRIYFFYSDITSSLSTNDTITFTDRSGSNPQIVAYSISGYTTSDSGVFNSLSSSSAAPYSIAGSGNATVANEINIAYVLNNNGSVSFPSSGWSSLTTPDNNTQGTMGYEVNTGTSPLTFSGSSSAGFYSALIAALKPSSSGSSPVNVVWKMLMGVGQ